LVLQTRDERFRLIRQAPEGLTESLRRAASEARGPLLARLDADDEAFPERFERQLKYFRDNSDVVAVGAAVQVPLGGRLRTYHYPVDHDGILFQLGHLLTPMPHPTLAMRREAFDAVGGYRSAFVKAQDYDLLLRLSERGRLANLLEPLVRLRFSEGSVSVSDAGGDQLQFAALAYACSVLRRSGRDPFESGTASLFISAFQRWYPTSRYPRLARSRKERRAARMELAAGRPVGMIASLIRAVWAYPDWIGELAGIQKDVVREIEAWALQWRDELQQ